MRISDWSSDVCSSDLDYPTLNEDSVFRLLVTGGSQGATILSSVVPEGLGLLPISLRRRLQVTQQCRVEDIDKVRAVYAELEIPADLATYLPDLPERLGWSHLVVARAGASTIAELTAARSEEHTSELQSIMRISYAVFCLKKKNHHHQT